MVCQHSYRFIIPILIHKMLKVAVRDLHFIERKEILKKTPVWF